MNAHKSILLEPATDWTGQDYHARLLAAAAVLFINDYLPSGEFGRINEQLQRDVDCARAEKARALK